MDDLWDDTEDKCQDQGVALYCARRASTPCEVNRAYALYVCDTDVSS